MSNDAIWVMDLFQMQLGAIRTELKDKKIKRDKFDKFSYSSWAICETLRCIGDYTGYISVGLIREILKMQLYDYEKYYNDNPEKHLRYKYAAEMIESLLNLTGGYIYD